MRKRDPFQPDDLAELGQFYARAQTVIAMDDVHRGFRSPDYIAVRHDCDNVIAPAVAMAAWEAECGYRSTYYVLHTSPYWQEKTLLRRALDAIASHGHEIGIHNDALTVALLTGRDPRHVLEQAVAELRSYGHTVTSTVAHGNRLCGIADYVNDEMFDSCARPGYGDPDRVLAHNGHLVRIQPVPLADFGLEFDANWLPRGDYLSDSGGKWSKPWGTVTGGWPGCGQLHMLVHPDWWSEAFQLEKAAA